MSRFWSRSPETGDADAFSEDDFYAVRAMLEPLNEAELAAFRNRPENHRLLRNYDRFAVRRILPYAAALGFLSVFSLTMAWALAG